jgi:O-antigen ligase
MIEALLGIDRHELRAALQRLRSDLAFAFLALLFVAVPLVRVSQLEDSFITPKVALAQWLLLPALLVIFLRVWRGGRAVLLLPLHSLFFGLFVAWSAVSLLYARSASLCVFALACFLTFLALHFMALFAVRCHRDAWTLIALGIGVAALMALWTVAEDFTHGNFLGRVVPRLPDWRGYLAAGLGNSGHIAGFVGMFYPAALIALLAAPRTPVLLIAALALMTAAAIVTWSVGSTGSMLIALLFCAAVALQPSTRALFRWRRLAWVVALGAVCLGFYLLPVAGNPHAPSLLSEAFGSQRWAEGWPTRVAIWKTTWHIIVHNPWLGIGFGNFTLEYVRQIVPSLVADPHLGAYAGAFTNEAHNEYLQVWAEGGIVALGLYGAMLLAFFARAHRLYRVAQAPAARLLVLASTAGVLVFVLDSLMSFPLRLPSHIAVLAVLMTLPESAAPDLADPRPTRVRGAIRWKRSAALTLVATLFGLLLLSTVVVGRRVAAEFYFKAGRMIAEEPIRLPGGSVMSPWAAAERTFARGVESLVAGRRADADRFFAAAREILRGDAFGLVEEHWRRALEWDPHYSNASSRYGAFLLMRGNYADAKRVLQQALRDLESHEVHERLGFAHYFLGDTQSAVSEWELCRQRRPLLADYYGALIRMARQ